MKTGYPDIFLHTCTCTCSLPLSVLPPLIKAMSVSLLSCTAIWAMPPLPNCSGLSLLAAGLRLDEATSWVVLLLGPLVGI